MNQFQKARVFMLPTERSKITISSIEGRLTFHLNEQLTVKNCRTAQHLHITIDNTIEKIKKGDWYIWEGYSFKEPIAPIIYQALNTNEEGLKIINNGRSRKIIATTDESLGYTDHRISPVPNFCNLARPSDSFIKKYCNKGGIDEILVEYKCPQCSEWGYINSCRNNCNQKFIELKVALDNTITIRPIKNSWNSEEVEAIARKAFSAGVDKGIAIVNYSNEIIESISGSKEEQLANEKFDAIPTENKWIEQNL